MLILSKALEKVLPIIDNNKLLGEYVEFKTKDNILFTKFLTSFSEGLSFKQIEQTLSVKDLISMDLTDDTSKELIVGFLNAFVNFYYREDTTSFCNHKTLCFNEIGKRLSKRYGPDLSVCFIDTKSDNLNVLSNYNFKIDFLDFIDSDFENRVYNCVSNNFLVLCNGYCLTKPVADEILEVSSMDNKNRLVIFFGPQSAFVSLIGLKRLCFLKEVGG